MKFLLALFACATTLSTFATDHIVEEFGQAPAHANITSAVAGAVDGDRIIVKNRGTVNLPDEGEVASAIIIAPNPTTAEAGFRIDIYPVGVFFGYMFTWHSLVVR